MPAASVEGLRCTRCDNEWVPRVAGRKPKNCPRCNSPYWDRARLQAVEGRTITREDVAIVRVDDYYVARSVQTGRWLGAGAADRDDAIEALARDVIAAQSWHPWEG